MLKPGPSLNLKNRSRIFCIVVAVAVSLFLSGCKPSISTKNTEPSPKLQAAIEKAQKMMEDGSSSNASIIFRNLYKVLPENSDVLCGLGDGERDLGHEEDAVDYYQKALASQPKHIGALYGLGHAYVDLKKYDKAEHILNIGKEVDPSVPGIHFLLGELNYRIGRYHEALSHMEETLRVCPTYMRANFFMAECYAKLGMYEQARSAYRAEARVNCLARPGLELDLAQLRTLEEPKSAADFFDLGELLEKHHDVNEAIEALETCRQLDPTYPRMAAMLGRLYANSGEKLKARAFLTEAIMRDPNDSQSNTELEDLNARILVEVALETKDNLVYFKNIHFPDQVIVAAEGTCIYDYNLNVIRTLPRGSSTPIIKLHNRVAQMRGGGPDQFYEIADGPWLIPARDVILKQRYDNPSYVSANRKLQVIENPIASSGYYLPDGDDLYGGSELWLKAPKGLVNLGTCGFDSEPVNFSPDEKYIFRPGGKIYSEDGSLFWSCPECEEDGLLRLLLVSPTWDGDRIYMRSALDGDDAVYMFNLKSKKLSKLIDVPDAQHIPGFEGSIDWQPARVNGDYLWVTFERWDPKAEAEENRCLQIEVKADKEGRIIEKTITMKRETNSCPSP